MAKRRGPTTRRPSSDGAKTPAALAEYEDKRDFSSTPEPAPGLGSESRSSQTPGRREKNSTSAVEADPPSSAAALGASSVSTGPLFVVQRHQARRLHYDVRLQRGDVLVSFAVPKGPSYDPKVKRLAVHVEDHPLDYAAFQGTIPSGQYGAGEVAIWDRGTFELGMADLDLPAMIAKGHIHVVLHGDKLRGGWHFVRTRDEKTWLFFKAQDPYANPHFDVMANDAPASRAGGDSGSLTSPPSTTDTRSLLAVVGEVSRAMSIRLQGPPSEYLFEIKYDGYRILAAKAGGEVRLVSRNGHDWTARFPDIARAIQRLPVNEVVLDGEACVVDDQGRPSFESLQRHLSGERDVGRLAFPAFDLLWLDGKDLRSMGVELRRRLLEAILGSATAPLTFSTSIQGELHAVLEAARTAGLEGLVAKRKGSPYVPGPTPSWIKIKFELRQDCVVCGYTPMSGTNVAGALILGLYDAQGRFIYAGRVGTGMNDALRAQLAHRLDAAATHVCPFEVDPRIPDARWARADMCIEIGVREWTRDGNPRFPRFLGFREDKEPRECVRESTESFVDTSHAPRGKKPSREALAPLMAAALHAPLIHQSERNAHEAGLAGERRPNTVVPITNATKVLYPNDAITKRDVFDYYTDVAAVMLPHLRGRPIHMQRWPDGIHDKEWFQHAAPPRAPTFVRQLPFDADPESESGKRARKRWRIVVENVETLQYLANLAVLTIHQRTCHLPPDAVSDESITRALATPDYIVIDLDPGDGPYSDLIEVALATRRLLDALQLESVVKTSGKRGLHIMAPLAPGHTHEHAFAFASEVARAVAKVMPEISTTEMSKELRRGRLYVDAVQNGRGRALVSPYSLRALDGAPVSTPLEWSEVTTKLDPAAFTLRTIRRRIDARGDLLAPLLKGRGVLPRVQTRE